MKSGPKGLKLRMNVMRGDYCLRYYNDFASRRFWRLGGRDKGMARNRSTRTKEARRGNVDSIVT